MPTPEPGIYLDVAHDDYNSWPDDSVRSSWLAKLVDPKRTPAHLRSEIDNPEDSTPDQALGTLIHAAVLEPERFHRTYAAGPDVKLNTNVGKEQWAKAGQQHSGKTLLRWKDWEVVEGIVDSVWKKPHHSKVRESLLACPQREVTVVWIDEATGMKCRIRIDALSQRAGVIMDVKSTRCAHPEEFKNSIVNFGYDVQAAMYREGAAAAGWDIRDTLITAYEKEKPYLASVLEITDEIITIGRMKFRAALELWAECKRTNHWPGYGDRTHPVNYPDWYIRKLQAASRRL